MEARQDRWPVAPLRLGRSGVAGRRSCPGGAGEEQRVIAPPTQAGEPAELPDQSSALQRPLQATKVLGGIRGRPGRSAEAEGRGPPRPEQQERKGGHLPHPLEPRKFAGLPGEVPCPLRPGVEGTPGPRLFLEPKPHPPHPSGHFPALWVLSIGPTYRPNITLHSQDHSPPFTFFLFPPPPFNYCGTDVPSGC